MRLVPDSIAGRTTAMLVAGTLVILAAGAIVTSLGVFEEAAPRRNARLMERTVMLVSVLNAVPAEARAAVVESVRLRGMRLRWSAEAPPSPTVAHDWFSAWTERRLRHALGPFGVGTVLVGHEPGRGAGNSDRAPVHGGRAIMWIELGDGTWLNIVPSRAWHSGSSLGYFALMVVIVGGGLAGLAVFVARWVTAPLGRFASASARLGHDVDAAAWRSRPRRDPRRRKGVQPDAAPHPPLHGRAYAHAGRRLARSTHADHPSAAARRADRGRRATGQDAQGP